MHFPSKCFLSNAEKIYGFLFSKNKKIIILLFCYLMPINQFNKYTIINSVFFYKNVMWADDDEGIINYEWSNIDGRFFI